MHSQSPNLEWHNVSEKEQRFQIDRLDGAAPAYHTETGEAMRAAARQLEATAGGPVISVDEIRAALAKLEGAGHDAGPDNDWDEALAAVAEALEIDR